MKQVRLANLSRHVCRTGTLVALALIVAASAHAQS